MVLAARQMPFMWPMQTTGPLSTLYTGYASVLASESESAPLPYRLARDVQRLIEDQLKTDFLNNNIFERGTEGSPGGATKVHGFRGREIHEDRLRHQVRKRASDAVLRMVWTRDLGASA